jgi:hypothetical protein
MVKFKVTEIFPENKEVVENFPANTEIFPAKTKFFQG